MVFVCNMRIKTEFVFHEKINENADGNSDGKTDDGDERIGFVLSDIPQSDFHMTFHHCRFSKNGIKSCDSQFFE